MDWTLAAVFVVGGALGTLLRARVAHGLSRKRGLLTPVFAGLIVAVAAYILARSLGLIG